MVSKEPLLHKMPFHLITQCDLSYVKDFAKSLLKTMIGGPLFFFSLFHNAISFRPIMISFLFNPCLTKPFV